MKEIEILVEIKDDFNKVKQVLDNFEYIGVKYVIDEYYYDPKRDDLKPNSKGEIDKCLRLRTLNDKYYLTYKDDVFDNGKWLYSNEYETLVDSMDMMKKIFTELGYKKLLEINNKKTAYQYNDYEIVIENVSDLGIFMEVEYCTSDDVDVKLIKSEIQGFIDSLGILVSDELNMGKPEMMIKKQNVVIE